MATTEEIKKSAATAGSGAGLQASYNDYLKSGGTNQAVTGMYDAQKKAQLGALETAYNQNLSDAQAAKEQIGRTYQTAANDLSTQYERNRRNLNIQAAGNGINTGTGSQQRLALQSIYNRDFGNLRGKEAADVTEADRGINNLTQKYRSDVVAAEANADAARNSALLSDYYRWYGNRANEYDRDYQRERTSLQDRYNNAQTLASYGNFSGYKGILSDDQIAAMEKSWTAANPLLAYNTGKITAAQYKNMTGQDAPNTGSSGGGGGGGYSGYRGVVPDTTDPTSGVPLSPEEAVLQMRAAGATSEEIRNALADEAKNGTYTAADVAAGNSVLAGITRNERESQAKATKPKSTPPTRPEGHGAQKVG